MNVIDARVCGIPCKIQVDTFNVVKPCRWADNPYDYYGYEEIEFTILTTRGKKADWLFNKVEKTDGELERIEQLIIEDAIESRMG